MFRIVICKKHLLNRCSRNAVYPVGEDNCLLCHQPLSEDAKQLITNYWRFIKSVKEENARKAQEALNILNQNLENLNFDLFPDENILTAWLTEKYPEKLEILKQELSRQKLLSENIISDIRNKTTNNRKAIKINVAYYTTIEKDIDDSIEMLNEDEQSKKLEKFLEEKIYLEHKQKFNTYFSKFENYVNNQSWIQSARLIDFKQFKKKITDTEKLLSGKYFNRKYIKFFNEECKKLNGNFGIEISYTGSAGKSYRQLKLKGKNPNAVLSEGEQRVIAIADFIAEMKLSEVCRGIIFDDPVTSLDETRKSNIAFRLAEESRTKQVVIFTHDLVFVSSLIDHCENLNITNDCHWIENCGGNQPGKIWLKNTPSFEKNYKKSGKAQQYYEEAKKLPPESREDKIRNGFAALRTSYEAQVVFSLFGGVVQRFTERVSIDNLKDVYFTKEIRDEILDSFRQCCRYMEGHSHSDKYAYKKPSVENLNEEIQRFNRIKNKIKEVKNGN